MRCSRILQGLPPDSPPAMEGRKGETIERPTSTDARIENPLASGTREEFFVYDNPLVEQPPTANTAFHFPMEGCWVKYCLD